MIPQLLLEQILSGEKDEKDFYSKYGREELQKAVADLKKSNEEIFNSYSSDDMETAVLKKMMTAKSSGTANPANAMNISSVDAMAENKKNGRSAKRLIHRISFSALKYSAAAILVFAFATPLIVNQFKKTDSVAASDSIRIKGNGQHQIRLYRQNGNDAVVLKNGETAKENDLIQITYIPGVYNYGVIFSVDGNKNITRHFPEKSWKAEKLEKTGQEVPLSFSYSLDDAPEYECFIFVASKKEFDFAGIEKINREKFNIDFLKNGTYLPKDCDGSIFVLKKE